MYQKANVNKPNALVTVLHYSSSASGFASSSFAALLAALSSPFTSDREVYEAGFVSEKRSFDHSIASEEPARYLLPVLVASIYPRLFVGIETHGKS